MLYYHERVDRIRLHEIWSGTRSAYDCMGYNLDRGLHTTMGYNLDRGLHTTMGYNLDRGLHTTMGYNLDRGLHRYYQNKNNTIINIRNEVT